MKWIKVKMKELGVESNPNYKIAFYVDSLAMISVQTQQYGVVDVSQADVKHFINWKGTAIVFNEQMKWWQ